MKTLRTKVLVIGGGPAGSTSARILASHGIDTILIDKDLSFIKPCGGAIPSSAFQELNIPYNVIKKEVRKVKFLSPKDVSVEIVIKEGFIAMVQRGEFDTVLRDMAEKSGASLIQAQFKRFLNLSNPITSEVMLTNTLAKISSDYVISGDGINSSVLMALGIKASPSALTITGTLNGYELNSCEFWFGSSHAPGFYSWVFPTEDGIRLGTGSSIKPRDVKTFLKNFLLRRSLPSPTLLRGYMIPIWQGKPFTALNGRVFFVGDSGAQVMPLTFEGIYYAMKSAEFATISILNNKPDDYKKLWEKRFYSKFLFMKNLWGLFVKNPPLIERLVILHQKPSVQEMAIRLWLNKDTERKTLLSYIKVFKGIFTKYHPHLD